MFNKTSNKQKNENKKYMEEIASYIYEATRIEAIWSKRPIVPEEWGKRDDAFKKQFINVVADYLNADKLPSPEEAHNSWMEAYFNMGWRYGEKRDAEKKTHPDLVPYEQLEQAEKDKDAIFLSFIWLTKKLYMTYCQYARHQNKHTKNILAIIQEAATIQYSVWRPWRWEKLGGCNILSCQSYGKKTQDIVHTRNTKND